MQYAPKCHERRNSKGKRNKFQGSVVHHSSQIMVIYYKSQKNLKTELQIDVNSPVFAYYVSILNYHILYSINICK